MELKKKLSSMLSTEKEIFSEKFYKITVKISVP